MENFVLKGKAKTVFRLIELMAKGEKAEQVQKTGKKQSRQNHQKPTAVYPVCGLLLSINQFITGGYWFCLHLIEFCFTPSPSPARTIVDERKALLAGEGC